MSEHDDALIAGCRWHLSRRPHRPPPRRRVDRRSRGRCRDVRVRASADSSTTAPWKAPWTSRRRGGVMHRAYVFVSGTRVSPSRPLGEPCQNTCGVGCLHSDMGDIEFVEATAQIVHPFRWSPVVGQRHTGSTAPEGVSEHRADVPSHHAGDVEWLTRVLAVLGATVGNRPVSGPWEEGSESHRRFTSTAIPIVENGMQCLRLVIPRLVVAMEITVNEDQFDRNGQDLVSPVTPSIDLTDLIGSNPRNQALFESSLWWLEVVESPADQQLASLRPRRRDSADQPSIVPALWQCP